MTTSKMTLEEAIQHAKDQAEKLAGTPCGEQHAQLAGWLSELREKREVLVFPVVTLGNDPFYCIEEDARADAGYRIEEIYMAPPSPTVPDVLSVSDVIARVSKEMNSKWNGRLE